MGNMNNVSLVDHLTTVSGPTDAPTQGPEFPSRQRNHHGPSGRVDLHLIRISVVWVSQMREGHRLDPHLWAVADHLTLVAQWLASTTDRPAMENQQMS